MEKEKKTEDRTLKLIYDKTNHIGLGRDRWIRTLDQIRKLPSGDFDGPNPPLAA